MICEEFSLEASHLRTLIGRTQPIAPTIRYAIRAAQTATQAQRYYLRLRNCPCRLRKWHLAR